MSIEVTVLGTSSATPGYGRFMTSHYLAVGNHHILLDCGEGAQYQLLRFKLKHAKISHILITHLHGDHYFGLPGLLSTMSLQKRNTPLTIAGPRGIKEILAENFKWTNTVLSFELTLIETETDKVHLLLENNQVSVYTFPLQHRVACTGFRINQKPGLRKLLVDTLPTNLPVSYYQPLKEGQVIKFEGKQYLPEQHTLAPPKPASYAFCTDTAYFEKLPGYVEGVNLLYHEATFAAADHDQAIKTCHSTTIQAATVAKEANAQQLLLGHFSVRYKELAPLLSEAQAVFPQTLLAEEGTTYTTD